MMATDLEMLRLPAWLMTSSSLELGRLGSPSFITIISSSRLWAARMRGAASCSRHTATLTRAAAVPSRNTRSSTRETKPSGKLAAKMVRNQGVA